MASLELGGAAMPPNRPVRAQLVETTIPEPVSAFDRTRYVGLKCEVLQSRLAHQRDQMLCRDELVLAATRRLVQSQPSKGAAVSVAFLLLLSAVTACGAGYTAGPPVERCGEALYNPTGLPVVEIAAITSVTRPEFLELSSECSQGATVTITPPTVATIVASISGQGRELRDHRTGARPDRKRAHNRNARCCLSDRVVPRAVQLQQHCGEQLSALPAPP